MAYYVMSESAPEQAECEPDLHTPLVHSNRVLTLRLPEGTWRRSKCCLQLDSNLNGVVAALNMSKAPGHLDRWAPYYDISCQHRIYMRLSCRGLRSRVSRGASQIWNDTEKISMAPAQG